MSRVQRCKLVIKVAAITLERIGNVFLRTCRRAPSLSEDLDIDHRTRHTRRYVKGVFHPSTLLTEDDAQRKPLPESRARVHLA